MSIFRAYDIRGVYGRELTDDIMTKIGMAVGTYCQGNFTVGRDFREHGTQLERALVSGLKKSGSNAYMIGTCPASLCVFANWQMRNDVAAYVTASHLPAEWNGVKFFHQDGVGFFEAENKKLEEISSLANFRRGKGQVTKLDGVKEKYIDFVMQKVKPEETRVVVDFGNGAACLLVPEIFKKMSIKADFLFDWPDPSFSNRDPEPKPESLKVLCRTVVEKKADLGIAFDADGDRAMFVDNMGRVMMTEQSAILFIRDIMKTQKGPVVANVECSDIIEDEVKKYGEDVFRIPVGHTFLVQETKKHKAVFGVEKSGHICVPKFYWFDDAIINSFYMIEIVSKMRNKLSNVLKELPFRFFERIEIDCSDETKFRVLDRIKEEAKRKYDNVDTIEGAKIVFRDSWALIRASNTSPELRLSLEAKDQKRINELRKQMMNLIRRAVPDLKMRVR